MGDNKGCQVDRMQERQRNLGDFGSPASRQVIGLLILIPCVFILMASVTLVQEWVPVHRWIWSQEGLTHSHNLILQAKCWLWGDISEPKVERRRGVEEQCTEREPGQGWSNLHKPLHQFSLIRQDFCFV